MIPLLEAPDSTINACAAIPVGTAASMSDLFEHCNRVVHEIAQRNVYPIDAGDTIEVIDALSIGAAGSWCRWPEKRLLAPFFHWVRDKLACTGTVRISAKRLQTFRFAAPSRESRVIRSTVCNAETIEWLERASRRHLTDVSEVVDRPLYPITTTQFVCLMVYYANHHCNERLDGVVRVEVSTRDIELLTKQLLARTHKRRYKSLRPSSPLVPLLSLAREYVKLYGGDRSRVYHRLAFAEEPILLSSNALGANI